MNKIDDSSPEARFAKLMKRVRRLGFDSLGSDDALVSPAQMALMDWVSINPGCGIQDLAQGLNLSPPTISVSIKKMVINGVIERKPDPSDARSVQLFLTNYGQEINLKQHAFQIRMFKQLLSGLSQKEQNTLLDLLERALKSVEIQ